MLNFNVDPYYDDFDPNNNYHRVLFRPGRAVQARELTQSQTILQDQISKFANHIFKQNTPVTGGQVTINRNAIYLKLNLTYNDNDIVASDFLNQVITDSTNTIFAKVIATEEATTTDSPTLIVTYLSGRQFSAGDLIYSTGSSTVAQLTPTDFTGLSTTASISEGVFYIVNGYSFSDTQNEDGTYSRYSIGNFVSVQPQTIIVQKYGNTPTKRIGLSISEFVSDYVTEPNLLDPAVGATNYQAPGADRYTITLTLDTKDVATGSDDNFIELTRVTGGVVQRLVNGTVYGVINDYFAKRTHDTNGDFIVNDFRLTPKANTENAANYKIDVGTGVAYVKGYRVESTLDTTLEATRARDTELINNNNLTLDFGNYIYVNNANGAFDVTKVISVDFHTINTNSSIVTTNTVTYNSTKAGSALLRGLEFESASNNANTRTYIYKAYIADIKANTLTGTAAAATTNTIQFQDTNGKFSSVNNAYLNASITIDSGTSSGDVRKIISYNGSTKTATVDAAFTVTPTTSSNFSLRFRTNNFNLLTVPTSSGFAVQSSAGVDNLSKSDGIVSGVSTLPTVIGNPTSPELIFNIGYPYVNNLSDETYQSWKMSRNVSFASGQGQFSLTGDITFAGTASATQSSSEARENWTIIVTNKQSSAFENGQIINFSSAPNTIVLDSTKKIATLTAGNATFTGTILARTAITDAGTTGVALKIKNLIQANTTVASTDGTDVGGVKVDLTNGQVYIRSQFQVAPGSAQTLYISDVKRIVKVIDTGSPSIAATNEILANISYDVTQNFILDNGQTDSYYGHASIRLRPGAPKPRGNLLVLVDYFQHAGGDGYFSVNSYLGAEDDGVSSKPENYAEIGTYTAKVSGVTYNLRDCIDYRLSVVNAQPNLEFRYSTSILSNGGALLPVDNSTFITDYTHFLGRKDIIVLTTDNQFKLIKGKSDNRTLFPPQPDGSIMLAKLTLDPYTAFLPGETTNYLPNLSIEKVQHKRWRMQDISELQTRVNNIEYYTSLSLLEKQASDLQVPDANGLNRFKNGILVDNFTGFAVSDTSNDDFESKINKRLTTMTAQDWVLNAPLFNLNALYAYGNLSQAAQNSLTYKYHSKTGGTSSVITLPYSTANLVIQKLASSTVSLNPFAVVIEDGVLDVNPPMDMWVDNEKEPDILIIDPNMTLFRQGNTLNTLSASDWQGISGTTYSTSSQSGNQVTVNTYQDLQRQTVNGNYDRVSSVNGNFITDVSVQPYIRSQNLILRAKGMKINTPVSVYFDGTKVNDFVIYPNIVELTNVTGTFEEGDVVGYVSSGNFVPTARVVAVSRLSSSKVRLYVSSDNRSQSAYSPTPTLIAGKFNAQGQYTGTPSASGTYSSASSFQISLSGQVEGTSGGTNTTLPGGGTYVVGATTVTLSPLASSVNDFYNGSTITFTTVNQRAVTRTGYTTVRRGWRRRRVTVSFEYIEYETFNETFSANILDYVGSTKVVTLSNVVNLSLGDNSSAPDGQPTKIVSGYSIKGTTFLMTQATSSQKIPSLSTDENGSFTALLQLPGGIFRTGDRTIRIDNRVTDSTPETATTFAQGIFTASSLATKSTSLNFGGTIQAAAKSTVFTATEQAFNQLINTTSFTIDPIAQTFMIDQATYPNGAFISSIKVYFRTKPTGTSAVPVKLFITDTLNGYPNGQVIDGSLVTKTAQEVNVSDNPQFLDRTTFTEFVFDSPVYIRSGNLYAFILQTTTPDYTVWTAAQNSIAVPSSVKNLPTDQPPAVITKIGGSPYIGALFESQNGITWTADQTKNLMFVIDNCIFDTTATPDVQYVVPKKIPLRKKMANDLEYRINANTASNIDGTLYAEDVVVDAFNITTTDFTPTNTDLAYTYRASLYSDYNTDTTRNVQPGKFATTMEDHIYLDDGKGPRVLDANSDTSFVVTATLSSSDKYVSPVLSDDGLSVYAIKYNITNMDISNTDILVTSGNTAGVTAAYTSTPPTVTIDAPTAVGGQQAFATANLVSNGTGGFIVDRINVTSGGSGYIATPSITISANGTGATATAIVKGETSSSGGNGLARYITKKVVLTSGNDSGDLRVYYTAYKPVGSSILVYYKILNRNDTEKFEDQNWQIMTETSGANVFSLSRDDLREYVSSPGSNNTPDNKISYTSTSGLTYDQFSQFAIKIVLATSDSTKTPVIHDLRVLALPSGA